VRLFVAIAAGGLVLALGGNSVVHGIAYAVAPLVEKARSPSMAVVIFHFGACVLAAFGLDALRDPAARAWIRRIAVGLALACAAWFLVLLAILVANPAAYRDERFALPIVAGLPLAAILYGAGGRTLTAKTAGVLATGLLLIEAGNVSGYNLPNRHDSNVTNRLGAMAQDSDLVQFLRRQGGVFRVEVDSEAIPFNFGDWHGLDTSNGYLASITANVWGQDTFTPAAARRLNIRYSIGVKPSHEGQREVFTGAGGRKVFENPNVLPRAWSVHSVQALENADAIREFLKTADPSKQAAMRGEAPALEACEGEDRVTLVGRGINWLEADAVMGCRGLVIVSDTWYPGWVAHVDGQRRPILEVNGMLRGIVVEGGAHRIEMRYRPGSVMLGAAMTGAGVLVTLGWSVFAWRRGRARLADG
jgi:hypothetical protein